MVNNEGNSLQTCPYGEWSREGENDKYMWANRKQQQEWGKRMTGWLKGRMTERLEAIKNLKTFLTLNRCSGYDTLYQHGERQRQLPQSHFDKIRTDLKDFRIGLDEFWVNVNGGMCRSNLSGVLLDRVLERTLIKLRGENQNEFSLSLKTTQTERASLTGVSEDTGKH